MTRKRFMLVVGLVVAFSMLLASCAPKVAPGSVPVRKAGMGGYLDEIDYAVVDAASVITQITAGAVDLFSYGLASDKAQEIRDAGLCYSQSYGTYYSLIFNPAVFTDTTRLNPFSNTKVREAINWAVDRNYINQEIFAGGALAKFLPLTTQLVDYTAVIEVARGLEAYYAFDMAKAQAGVDAGMAELGATKGADGKWEFNGAPLSVKFLIRNDGDGTRLPMGNYVANQMETLGFTVDRQEGKSSELSPLWIGSDPYAGEWNVYTGGWGSSGLNRDERTIFQEMYLADSAQGIPLFTANVSDPAFLTVGDDLANGNYTTLEQRHDKIVEALPLSLKDSLQVWLVDTQTYAPFKCNIAVSADVGAGVETTKMAPFTLRYTDKEGGQIKSATTATLFTDPWNPVNGANWVTSAFVQNGLAGGGVMPDPYTGLFWPLFAEKADLVVQTGLPVQTNLNWVNLTFADTIAVPADAWSDWDPATQKFITAGEKFPEGATSKMKAVIYYPKGMYDKVRWHDGTKLSAADFVMQMIELFDYAKEGSAIYDEDQAGNLEAFLTHFKGVKILSTDPLVIESYDDNVYSDAEVNFQTTFNWWPQYGYGEAPWQTIAVGNAAVAAKELAWGTGQADRNTVEWMSLIGGPSLEILNKYLDQLTAAKTIPYEPTMGAFLKAKEVDARYAALKAWYTTNGNFWVGTGPYYLASADLNAGSCVVKNNGWYPDKSDRWAKFGTPPLGLAFLEGPSQLKIGEAAEFSATFTYKSSGDPYPSADIKGVKFLIYDSQGVTVYVGEGVAAGTDGKFTLTVPADVTAQLEAGAGRIEVAGVFIPVAIPAFTSLDYVVAP
jgi:peptide/nickel transport system substrate-binding protein